MLEGVVHTHEGIEGNGHMVEGGKGKKKKKEQKWRRREKTSKSCGQPGFSSPLRTERKTTEKEGNERKRKMKRKISDMLSQELVMLISYLIGDKMGI